MSEQSWADVFDAILPGIHGTAAQDRETLNTALEQYRAECQIRLGQWMFAREAEQLAQSRERR